MRLLLLLRHAKALRDSGGGDEGRALDDRGRAAAATVGRWLAKQERLRPDLVLVSSAQRTRETWETMEAEMTAAIPARFHRDLYLASPESILAVVAGVPRDSERLMVVGHNPGIHELARHLVGLIGARTAARLAFDRMREKFPTGALAVIAFPKAQSWRDAHFGSGRFESFIRPKDLR
jgi:phosphohistidine phosphatase